MKWTKFTLDTTTEAVDLISDMLYGLGIEGIEICDKVPITEEDMKTLFVDYLPDLGEDDGLATISFYVEPTEDIDSLLMRVREGLSNLSEFVSIGSGIINISETEDKDWINNWKQFFKPFRIDDTIVIKPTWEAFTERKEKDLIIEIDPGISFGTGSHETTKLAILSLKKYMKPGFSVLDAGSGSGILSIIAKKLGANEVIGIDIDPLATDASFENAEVNHIATLRFEDYKTEDIDLKTSLRDAGEGKNLSFITGNIIQEKEIRSKLGSEYDIVVANILADVIIPLTEVVEDNLKSGGFFIISGIINTKEEAVSLALEKNHFKILEVNHMGDWVSFVATK